MATETTEPTLLPVLIFVVVIIAVLIDLSRNDGVTIFVSTHFMNEAARCDRIALMNAGKVLATDTPGALVQARGVATLEDAFIL